jgi:hypothetical protein
MQRLRFRGSLEVPDSHNEVHAVGVWVRRRTLESLLRGGDRATSATERTWPNTRHRCRTIVSVYVTIVVTAADLHASSARSAGQSTAALCAPAASQRHRGPKLQAHPPRPPRRLAVRGVSGAPAVPRWAGGSKASSFSGAVAGTRELSEPLRRRRRAPNAGGETRRRGAHTRGHHRHDRYHDMVGRACHPCSAPESGASVLGWVAAAPRSSSLRCVAGTWQHCGFLFGCRRRAVIT